MDHPKFAAFNVSTTPYKTVNDHEIPLYVLIPKDAPAGPRPVIVHFHGGFLCTGHAIYPDWAAQWALDYQALHSAIRVSANYRLLPESNGLEILEDIRDVWKWVEEHLPQYLKSIGSRSEADLGKVAVYGDSAGGYLAIQSGLTRPDLVRAVIAAYPMTYVDEAWYSVASASKSPMGVPQLPRSILENHVKSMEKGTVETGVFPPDRMPIALTMLQGGHFVEYMGTDASIYPAKVLETFRGGEKGPFLYLLHGKQDSAVPAEHSERFVEAWKGKFGQDSVVGKFEDGDHGHDGEATLETPWMKEGLDGVTKSWIG